MEIATHKPFEGESLYSFHFDHLAKIEAMKANFSDSDKVSLIVGAIGDDTVTSAVRAVNITNLNQLASYLRDRTFAQAGPSNVQFNETRYEGVIGVEHLKPFLVRDDDNW